MCFLVTVYGTYACLCGCVCVGWGYLIHRSGHENSDQVITELIAKAL